MNINRCKPSVHLAQLPRFPVAEAPAEGLAEVGDGALEERGACGEGEEVC